MILKLKYHSGYIYEYFLSLVLHNDIPRFLLLCAGDLSQENGKQLLSEGAQRWVGGPALVVFAQGVPLLDFLPSQSVWATEHKRTDV